MIYRCALLLVLLGLSLGSVSQTRPAHAPTRAPGSAADEATTYRNPTFGFRYQIPFGWVDRTREMHPQGTTAADAAKTDSKAEKPAAKENEKEGSASAGSGEILLAIFERPPDAAGDTVNSAVVIATEPAASYPGLKTAEDYLDPLTELAGAKGLKADGDPSTGEIDGREVVRADFSKPLNDKLTMRQSTLVMVVKGQILSFTFIAGSKEEVSDLIEELSFNPAKSKR